MIKDRLSELRQVSQAQICAAASEKNEEEEKFLPNGDVCIELEEKCLESNSNDKVDYHTDNDEEESWQNVPHTPVLEALFKVYSEILHEFDIIQQNLTTMQNMVLAKNLKKFNDKEFFTKRQLTIQVANNIMGKFQTIELNLPKDNDMKAVARMKRILYYGIFQRYVEIWTKTEKFLQEYEQSIKDKLRAQSRILEVDLTEEEIETLVSNKETSLYSCNILEDTEIARKTLKALTERLGELKKLEKSIQEVHTLFLRLQRMVLEQGAVMQSIEKHYNDAQIYVEEAAEDIAEAKEIYKSSVKKRLILIIISIILITITIFINIFAFLI